MMAPQQMTLFEQMIDEIGRGRGLFVDTEKDPRGPRGMKRAPFRTDVLTGQGALPMRKDLLPGPVVKPEGLSAAGVHTLPWEQRVRPQGPPPSFNPQLAIGPGTPAQIPGQGKFVGGGTSMLDDIARAMAPAAADPIVAGPASTPGAPKSAPKATTGAPKATTGASSRYAANMQSFLNDGAGAGKGAASGRAANLLSALGVKDGTVAGGSKLLDKAKNPGWIGRSLYSLGLGHGGNALLESMGTNDKLRKGEDLNPFEAFTEGAHTMGTLGMLGGPKAAAIAGLAGGVGGVGADLLNDLFGIGEDGGTMRDVIGQIPMVGDMLPAFGIGDAGPSAPSEEEMAASSMVQAGWGSDPEDVTRRMTNYQTLTQTGIDPDIAWEVSFADTPIGQQVMAHKQQQSSPLGDLAGWGEFLRARAQPLADRMRDRAGTMSAEMGSNAGYFADTVANAGDAYEASASLMPFLLEMQRKQKEKERDEKIDPFALAMQFGDQGMLPG